MLIKTKHHREKSLPLNMHVVYTDKKTKKLRRESGEKTKTNPIMWHRIDRNRRRSIEFRKHYYTQKAHG